MTRNIHITSLDYLLMMIAMTPDKFTADFYEWMKSNYSLYSNFESIAISRFWSGRKHYSARYIIEIMRHETAIRSEGKTKFTLDNCRIPDMERLYLLCHPEQPEFFEIRGRRL